MEEITENTMIGAIVIQKGVSAGKILDKGFCKDRGTCCPGVTLTLSTAAKNSDVAKDDLAKILQALNALPDVK